MAQAPHHPELHGRVSQFEAVARELEGRVGELEAKRDHHHAVHSRLTRAESSHKELIEQAERVHVLMDSMQALDNGVAEKIFDARMKDAEAKQLTLQRSVDNLHKQVADAEVTAHVAARVVQLEAAANRMEAKAQTLEGPTQAFPHSVAQSFETRLRDAELCHQELHAKVPAQLAARMDHLESVARAMETQAGQLEGTAHAAEVAARLEKLEAMANALHEKGFHLEGHAKDHQALAMRIASFEASHAELHTKAGEIHDRVSKMEGHHTRSFNIQPDQEDLRTRAQTNLSKAAVNGLLPKLALEAARVSNGGSPSDDGSPVSRQVSGSPKWSPRMRAIQQEVSEDVANQLQDLMTHLKAAEQRRRKLEKINIQQSEQIKGLEQNLHHALAGQFGKDVANQVEDLLTHLKAAEARRTKLEAENHEKDQCIARLEQKLAGGGEQKLAGGGEQKPTGGGAPLTDEEIRAREREVTTKLRARLQSPPGSPVPCSKAARDLSNQLRDKVGYIQQQHASLTVSSLAPGPQVATVAHKPTGAHAKELSAKLKNKLGELERHHGSAPTKATSKSVSFVTGKALAEATVPSVPSPPPAQAASKSLYGERQVSDREEELLRRCEAERQMRDQAESEAARLMEELESMMNKAAMMNPSQVSMQRQNTDQSLQIGQLREAIQDATHRHAEAEVRAEEARLKHEDALQQVKMAQREMDTHIQANKDLQVEVEALRMELQTAQTQTQTQTQAIELQQRLAQTQQQLASQQDELAQKDKVLQETRAQEQAAQQANNQLKSTVHALEARLQSAGNEAQDVSRLYTQVEAAEAKAVQFQQQAAQAQQATEQLQTKIMHDKAEIASLQEELRVAKNSMAVHEAELMRSKAEATSQSDYQVEINKLQNELIEAKQLLASRQAEIATLQHELRAARATHVDLQEKARDLELNLAQQNESKTKETDSKVQESETKVKDLQEAYAKMKTELNVAQANAANLEVRCTGYEGQFSRLQGDKKDLEAQVMQLKESLAAAQQQPPTPGHHSGSMPHGHGGSATAARAAAREAHAMNLTSVTANANKAYKKLSVPSAKVPGNLDGPRIAIPQTSHLDIRDGRKSNAGSPTSNVATVPASSPTLAASPEGGSCSCASPGVGEGVPQRPPISPERNAAVPGSSTAFPFPYNAQPLQSGMQARNDQQRLRLYAAPTNKPTPVQTHPVPLPTVQRPVMGVVRPILTGPMRPANR